MLKNYHLLHGTIEEIVGNHTKDQENYSHYTLVIETHQAGESSKYQVNIDTQSDRQPNVRRFSTVLFGKPLLQWLLKLPEGLLDLTDGPTEHRLDYLRSKLFDIQELANETPVSHEAHASFLKEHCVTGARAFVFGEYYDDQTHPHSHEAATHHSRLPPGFFLKHLYPHLPGRGVHQIHFNQGEDLSSPHRKANGIFQDGGFLIHTPDDRVFGIFFSFIEQSFSTDDSGNPYQAP